MSEDQGDTDDDIDLDDPETRKRLGDKFDWRAGDVEFKDDDAEESAEEEPEE